MNEKQYKQYKENLKKYQAKYKKEHYKTASVLLDRKMFEDEITPLLEKSGLTMNAWLKLAIMEKLERDKEQ